MSRLPWQRPPAGSDLHLGSTASSAMTNNEDEKRNNSLQNSSKPKSSDGTGTNVEIIQRRHFFNHDKAQCSDITDEFIFDTKTKKKYLKNCAELTNCYNKLNRNIGEPFLFKDVEYSQSNKGFCFNSNSGIKCTNEEENKVKHNTQKLLNNANNTKVTISEEFPDKINNNNMAHMLTSNVKLNEDKTTYCRPVLNYYNQQFLYKTMERNAKLKNLVRKLSIARQREKEKVNWNNFINELKNKHGYGSDDALLDEDFTPEIINDGVDTTFSLQKSRLCRNILRDFYGAYETFQPNRIHRDHQQSPQNTKNLPCNTNSFCYPTSSMGRLIMLRREQGNDKYSYNSEEVKKISNREKNVDNLDYKSFVPNSQGYRDMNLKNFKSSLVQVDNKVFLPFVQNIKKDKATSYSEVLFRHRSNETNTVDNYIKLENTTNSSLVNIENKLEYLIDAINSFMVQIKSHKRSSRDMECKKVPYKNIEKIHKKLNMTKSDSLGMRQKENKVVGEVADNSSRSILSSGYDAPTDAQNSRKYEILRDYETHNDDNYQNQYPRKLSKPCSLQISIELPTKDCCTEITKSLSKQVSDKMVTIEEITETSSIQDKMPPLQRMTIAVNTDPLSFLALLRFSTETIKRLISYMPNFDYLSYLSALNFLQSSRTAENNYICKICGAAYDNPTQLSEHIHGHDLGKTRDCCVCRHVVECTRTSLFSCQYCGQHFTRAYCCELHQQSCAKRLGKCHNVSSSLMLLR